MDGNTAQSEEKSVKPKAPKTIDNWFSSSEEEDGAPKKPKQDIDMTILNNEINRIEAEQDDDDDGPSARNITKDYSPVRRMIRVHPLAQLAPYKRVNEKWINPWKDAPFVDACHIKPDERKWFPGSVTCVVRKRNDPTNSLYIFTVGHACYDIDPWRKCSTNEDVQAGRASNEVPDFSWGEWKGADGINVVKAIGPFATSEGRYERGGDKMGSLVDCALMKISNGVLWSNQYSLCAHISSHSASAEKLKLVALDDTWSAARGGPDMPQKFMIRELELLASEFHTYNMFQCSLVNWQGVTDSTLGRVLIRRRPLGNEGNFANRLDHNGTSLRGGASGSALLRPGPKDGEAIVVAILIGRFSKWVQGKTKDDDWTEADTVYDVFQHVSMAQGIYNLENILPQPVDDPKAPFYLESGNWEAD